MTTPPFERYAGREQAWVKHYFLGNYLERLVHKVAAKLRHDRLCRRVQRTVEERG